MTVHEKIGGRPRCRHYTDMSRERIDPNEAPSVPHGPISYEQFLALSHQMSVDYLRGLVNRYGVGYAQIAAMMGVKPGTLGEAARRRGMDRMQSGRNLYFDADAWREFVASGSVKTPTAAKTPPPPRMSISQCGITIEVENISDAIEFLRRTESMIPSGDGARYIVSIRPARVTDDGD